jgi:L-amino acid N-acyltransferase YncA
MGPQQCERNDVQRPFVGCGKTNRAGIARLSRLQPSSRADTPAVTRDQPDEAVLGARRGEIVADRRRIGEKVGGDRGTDRVRPGIFLGGVAAAVPEKPGHRVVPTLRQRASENIANHGSIQPRILRPRNPEGLMRIRNATIADAQALRAIYNHEVEHTTATFDLVPRTLQQQQEWIQQRQGALGVIVAELDGQVVGFASLSPFRDRPAYNTTVENSIYVDRTARGSGVGRALLNELIEMAKNRGFHTMVAHISGTDGVSVALHQACGFTLTGVQREVGRKFGTWLDITIMQRMLDTPD